MLGILGCYIFRLSVFRTNNMERGLWREESRFEYEMYEEANMKKSDSFQFFEVREVRGRVSEMESQEILYKY